MIKLALQIERMLKLLKKAFVVIVEMKVTERKSFYARSDCVIPTRRFGEFLKRVTECIVKFHCEVFLVIAEARLRVQCF